MNFAAVSSASSNLWYNAWLLRTSDGKLARRFSSRREFWLFWYAGAPHSCRRAVQGPSEPRGVAFGRNTPSTCCQPDERTSRRTDGGSSTCLCSVPRHQIRFEHGSGVACGCVRARAGDAVMSAGCWRTEQSLGGWACLERSGRLSLRAHAVVCHFSRLYEAYQCWAKCIATRHPFCVDLREALAAATCSVRYS